MDEQWIDDAVTGIDSVGPRAGFEGELRSTLTDAWRGIEPPRWDEHVSRHRGWWIAAAAALVAAAVAGVVIGALVVGRSGPNAVMSPSLPPVAAPQTSVTPPSTSRSPASTNTAIDTTAPTTILPVPPPPDEPAITRPVIAADYCTPTYATASEPTLQELAFFSRSSTHPIAVQVIGSPDEDITKPYALVLRYFDGDGSGAALGEPIDVNGATADVYVGEYGQGQASWTLADGSQAYIRSRGLDADELAQYARSLDPRPADAAIPGFDIDGPLPGGATLIGESVGPYRFGGASSRCLLDDGSELQVNLVEGDLVARFATAVDFVPLPLLRQVGDDATLAMIPRADLPDTVLDDVVQATPQQWEDLLVTEPDRSPGSGTDLGTGAGIDLGTGSLWGLDIGEHRPAQAFAVTDRPGPHVTDDSGWFVTDIAGAGANETSCLDGWEQRIIWWGDASMAFNRRDDGVIELWSWTVGDVGASGWGDRGQPDPPQPQSSDGGDGGAGEVTTDDGIGVGSTVDEFLAAYGGTLPLDAADADGTRFGVWQPADGATGNFFVGVTVGADGRITGIGATRAFC